MFELRKNQEEPVKIGIDFFKQKKPKPSLMVEPVAFGKSIVIAHIAMGIKDLGKTLILQPSKELLEQNYSKFTSLGGEASIYSASMKTKEFGNITYATIGSIKEIGAQFKNYGYKYLIVDEADRYPRNADSMFGKFLKDSGITAVLGFTATPFKLQTNSFNMEAFSLQKILTSRSKHGNFFKDIIHVTQIQDLIKDGFWSPIVYEIHKFDDSELDYNSTKAEYTEESILAVYESEDIGQKIHDRITDLKDTRKSIVVFLPSVAEAHRLETMIPNSVAIWGDMSKKDRELAVDGFKSGKYKVALNVNVLSIGFDFPGIDCIILGRPTASLSLSYQQQGRGVRPHPDGIDCLIVDFVGTSQKFGRIQDLYFKKEAIWKLYGTEGKLLSGIPIHEIGTKTEFTETEEQAEKDAMKIAATDGKVIIGFGKFKGKEVKDTPEWWREWMLKNYEFNDKTQSLKNEILTLINTKSWQL